MIIAFATTQSVNGSTVRGRILPIARQLTNRHQIHLLVLNKTPTNHRITYHSVGREPFSRTATGKKRLSFPGLIFNMLITALRTTSTLRRIRPDVVIISKPLPHNVLGVKIWHLLAPRKKILLDVDDFELSANQTTSLFQRAAIHAAERRATKLSSHIITATPFLHDHFSFLSSFPQSITTIPTGISSLTIKHHPPTTPTITYLGSISISSGHRVDLLPDILQRLKKNHPNIKLIIAGNGDDITRLKQDFASRHLSDSVIWFGPFANSDLPKLLAQTTILIDPIDDSITNRAKSSFRVCLAGTTGLPVVTSNIGLRPQLLPTSLHQKLFAPAGDAAGYASKITALLNSTPLTSDDQQQLITHAQKFTWDNLARQYQSIIES